MVLFVFQLYPVCSFGKIINLGVGIVSSERVKPYSSQFLTINFIAGTVDAFTSLECEVAYLPTFSSPGETDFRLLVSGGTERKLKCIAKVFHSACNDSFVLVSEPF